MNIPNLIYEKVVDENGYLTSQWQLLFAQLFTQLQSNLSDEGYILPKLTDSQVTTLNPVSTSGALIYNSTNNNGMININGVFKKIVYIP
jgi:hypothetical protein